MPTTLMPGTSIEFWAWDTATEVIRSMASSGVFRAVGDDRIDPILPEAVIKRFNRRPSRMEVSRTGEASINVPGIIVSYMGHQRPAASGENRKDHGVITLLIQIVDDGDDGDATNAASYFRWMRDICERLQEGPGTHLSPLESCPSHLGNIYMVHCRELRSPDETDWAVERMRAAQVVEIFTSTSR